MRQDVTVKHVVNCHVSAVKFPEFGSGRLFRRIARRAAATSEHCNTCQEVQVLQAEPILLSILVFEVSVCFSFVWSRSATMADMEWASHILIPGCAIAGIVFAIFMWIRVSKVTVAPVASDDTARAALMEASPGEEAVCCCHTQFHSADMYQNVACWQGYLLRCGRPVETRHNQSELCCRCSTRSRTSNLTSLKAPCPSFSLFTSTCSASWCVLPHADFYPRDGVICKFSETASSAPLFARIQPAAQV